MSELFDPDFSDYCDCGSWLSSDWPWPCADCKRDRRAEKKCERGNRCESHPGTHPSRIPERYAGSRIRAIGNSCGPVVSVSCEAGIWGRPNKETP